MLVVSAYLFARNVYYNLGYPASPAASSSQLFQAIIIISHNHRHYKYHQTQQQQPHQVVMMMMIRIRTLPSHVIVTLWVIQAVIGAGVVIPSASSNMRDMTRPTSLSLSPPLSHEGVAQQQQMIQHQEARSTRSVVDDTEPACGRHPEDLTPPAARATVGGDEGEDAPVGAAADRFSCLSTKQCIDKRRVCDGRRDCDDNSDEALCSCSSDSACRRFGKLYRCVKNVDLAISECTPCPPGKRFVGDQCEDINECAGDVTPAHGGGPDVCPSSLDSCLNFDGGYACVQCPKGYEPRMHDWRYFVAANRSTGSAMSRERRLRLRQLFLCDDRNECELDNPCLRSGREGGSSSSNSVGGGQYCVNLVGSFTCQCPPKHAPGMWADRVIENTGSSGSSDIGEDNVCRAIGGDPQIVIAENRSFTIYNLRSSRPMATVEVDKPIVDIGVYKDAVFYAFRHQIWEYRPWTGLKSLVADFHYEQQQPAGPDADQTLPTSTAPTGALKRLAVDWLNKRLYVLTATSIAIVNFFGRGARIVEHRGTITGLAVDPLARYLFYSEQGAVRRLQLDGSPASKVLVFRALAAVMDVHVQSGEAIALDPNLQSIYYVHERVLYNFDYEGGHAVVLSTAAPFARIEPFEDRLFAAYRSDSSGLVSLPRAGYTLSRHPGDPGSQRRRRPSIVTFHTSRPRAMLVRHVAKFPEPRDTVAGGSSGAGTGTFAGPSPCFRADVCASGWCFPLPPRQATGHRCACAAVERLHDASCIRLRFEDFKPANDLVSSAEINAAAATTTAGGRYLRGWSSLAVYGLLVIAPLVVLARAAG